MPTFPYLEAAMEETTKQTQEGAKEPTEQRITMARLPADETLKKKNPSSVAAGRRLAE